MKIMKGLMTCLGMLAITAMLSAAACTTASIDQTLKDNLPQTCNMTQETYAAFTIVATTGSIKESLVNKVNATYAAVEVICDKPEQFTIGTAAVKLAQAYAAFLAAVKEAKAT